MLLPSELVFQALKESLEEAAKKDPNIQSIESYPDKILVYFHDAGGGEWSFTEIFHRDGTLEFDGNNRKGFWGVKPQGGWVEEWEPNKTQALSWEALLDYVEREANLSDTQKKTLREIFGFMTRSSLDLFGALSRWFQGK